MRAILRRRRSRPLCARERESVWYVWMWVGGWVGGWVWVWVWVCGGCLCFGDKKRKEKRRVMTFVLTKRIDSKVEVVLVI